MKPTPTQIEAAAKKQFELHHLTRWETASDEERSSHLYDAKFVLSAALSVPAAAVVGEPPIVKCVCQHCERVTIVPRSTVEAARRAAFNAGWDMHAALSAAPSAPDGLDEQALDKAAREGYAVRCKTHGPRVLDQYASPDIMQMQLDDARVIVSAYLAAVGDASHE